MTTEDTVLGSAEGSPQNQTEGATGADDPSVAGSGQEAKEAMSPEEAEKLRKRVTDLERMRSEEQSEKDKAIKRAEQLQAEVLGKLVDVQTAQLNKAEDPGKAMAELRKLAESAVNDGNVDGLIGMFQQVVKANDAYVDKKDAARQQAVDELKKELAAQIAEVKTAVANASPEYLAYKKEVDELMEMGVSDRATAIAIAKKLNPAGSEMRPDLPGTSGSSAVSSPKSGGMSAEMIADLNKGLDKPLTKAEIEYLNKGSK